MSHIMPDGPALPPDSLRIACSGFPNVTDAALYIQSYMIRRAQEFDLPRDLLSPNCWIAFLNHCGLKPFAVRSSHVTAVTLWHEYFGWMMIFDRSAPLNRQCRYMAHELSEFLMASLETDDAPCPERPQGMTLGEWRHAVSNEVVRLVFDLPQ